jgi:effector-binding domain-containing protein
MIKPPEIREIEPEPAAVIHAVTDASGIPAVIDRSFPAIFKALAEQHITPSGPPFIRYLQTGQQFELQLGVPVPAHAGQLQGVEDTSLPAGRVVVLRHIGPYGELRGACEELFAWVAEHGQQPGGAHWEVYVTDPYSEPDPAKRITDIYVPLAS